MKTFETSRWYEICQLVALPRLTRWSSTSPKDNWFFFFDIFLPLGHSSNFSGFSGGSDGKESVYSAGDPVSIPGSGRSLEKRIAPHSSILAWRIPWAEEPGGLQFMWSQKVRHDWATFTQLTHPSNFSEVSEKMNFLSNVCILVTFEGEE